MSLNPQSYDVTWAPAEINAPNLAHWVGFVMPGITKFTMNNISASAIFIVSASDLVSIECPNLEWMELLINIANANQTTASFPSLSTVLQDVSLSENNLQLVDLSSLSIVGKSINFNSNDNLTTFNLPSLSDLGEDFVAQNCALDETTVNNILIKLNDISWAAGGKSCILDGGTSAAPTGDGILAKDSMLSASATVNTN